MSICKLIFSRDHASSFEVTTSEHDGGAKIVVEQKNKEEIEKEKQIGSFLKKDEKNKVTLGDANSFVQINDDPLNVLNMSSTQLLNHLMQCTSLESTANSTPDKIIEPNQFLNSKPLHQLPSSNTSMQQVSQSEKELPKFEVSCRCQASACLKQYCSCFSKNTYCVPYLCKCRGCENTPDSLSFAALIQKMKQKELLQKRNGENEESEEIPVKITCTCKKSMCKKLYCECFKSGQGCGLSCSCINCLNDKVLQKN